MLETLQDRVYAECRSLENIERKVTGKRYSDVMKQGYNRTMFDIQKGVGVAFDFAKLPKKAIKETMLAGWKGRNFSKSIWKNTETMASLSQEIIKAGFLSGATIQTMVTQLDDVMHAGQFAAERLIRSETNYFANQGELRSYIEAGIEKYQYLATLDDRTSKLCQGLDGKIYLISEARVGENYPPMHAFCRSTTVAYFDDQTLENIERRARDPVTGKTYLVPADMDYKAWHDKYVLKSGSGNATISLKSGIDADFENRLKNAQGVTDDYRQALSDLFSNGTDIAKEVFIKYVPDDAVRNYNHTGTSHYSPPDRKILLNSADDMRHEEIRGRTFFHEHGHLLDNIRGGYISLTDDFRWALEDDYNSYIVSHIKANKVGKKQAYSNISQELAGFENAGVSDIYSGLSGGKCYGWSFHRKAYWKDDPDLIQLEAFAQMYTAHFRSEEYTQMGKYFPRAFKIFNHALEELR